MSFFSSNLIIKFRTGLIALLSVLLLQNSADATNNTTEREVAAWLEQMSAVINSRNPNVIKKFFSFYSSNSVQFIKKSSLYVAGLDDPVAEDNIVLNRDQYIKYVYGLTKYPKIYGYKAKLSSLKEQSDGTYLAAVTVEEIAVSEVENKVIVKVAAIGTEGGGGASAFLVSAVASAFTRSFLFFFQRFEH